MNLNPTPLSEKQDFNYEHIEVTQEDLATSPYLEVSLSKPLEQDSIFLSKLGSYKWVLLALFFLELLSATFSFIDMIRDVPSDSRPFEAISILLSLWDLYQIRLLYSALVFNDLKRLDEAIKLIKYFMVLVFLFSLILFYSKLYVLDWDPRERISLAKQTIILLLASGIVGGLVFMLYIFPAQKYRELLAKKEDDAELYGSQFIKRKF